MKSLLGLLLLFAMTAVAADITGTWKGTAETQNGTIERTFTFKQDGSKVTGETVSERFGKSPINDGKIDGDTVTFSVTMKFQDNEMKMNYKGKIEGDQIKLHVEAEGAGFSLDYVAKKVS